MKVIRSLVQDAFELLHSTKYVREYVLLELEKGLLEHLGFTKDMYENNEYPEGDYDDIAKKYGVKELEHEHEEQLNKDHGPVHFIKNFPQHTSPFWNMKLNDEKTHANKIDVILQLHQKPYL